jgi:hypothetical protein
MEASIIHQLVQLAMKTSLLSQRLYQEELHKQLQSLLYGQELFTAKDTQFGLISIKMVTLLMQENKL